jgi:long-subunit fatty acid transport protein
MGITLRAMDMTIRTRDITTRAKGKRKLLILCTACLSFGILSLYCSPAWAQAPPSDPTPTSSPVPVGSGARAQGMGGAFIAVADDATAASWNPGGLGQLQRPELSVVGSYFSHSEHYDRENQEGSHSYSSDFNYFSFAYAENIWRRNMFFSLNYQKLFDFTRKANFDFPPNPGFDAPEKVDFQQEGSLYAFSPALSLEVVPGLYAGVARNIWSDNYTGKSGWKCKIQSTSVFSTPPYVNILKTTSDYTDFRGENWTLGFLWKVTQWFQVGGVYKTPFEARVKNALQWLSIQDGQTLPYPFTGIREIAYRIDFPAAYGLGLSFKCGNSLTFAADVTRTEWQDYIIYDSSGAEVGPFAPSNGKVPEKDPTYTVRSGAEYAYILDKPKITVPVRVGAFYDPEPTINGDHQDFYGLSCGFGIVNERFALDFAYQFRWGDHQVSPYLSSSIDEGSIRQHFFLSSLIVYF